MRRSYVLRSVAASLLLSSCSNLCEEPSHVAAAPFHFDERSPVDNARISIEQASADYEAVVNGRPPVFAKFDTAHGLPADGGATFYKGSGYSLTIVKSLAQAGQVLGYIYGPVVTFDVWTYPDFPIVSGNSNQLSHVNFYSAKELNTLLGTDLK
jgi:hypothetical protein